MPKPPLFVLMVFLFLGARLAFCELSEEFYGTVYSQDGKTIAWERHEIYKEGGKVSQIKTLFYRPDSNKLLAVAESYFNRNYFLPDYYFHLLSNDFVARAVHLGNNLAVLLRKEKDQEFYFKKAYPIRKDMVVGHGFYYYLFDHLEALLENPKRKEPVQFLIPNKLSDYIFQMSAEKDPKNNDIAIVTLTPKNPIYQLLTGKIVVKVDINKKYFLSYEGPNSFLFEGKEVRHVRVDYSNYKKIN